MHETQPLSGEEADEVELGDVGLLDAKTDPDRYSSPADGGLLDTSR